MAATKREALHAAAEQDKVIFAVCGGYQLLGHSYELDGDKLPGVGLVDLRTVRGEGARLIGNVAIEVALPGLDAPRVLAGFENHGGRTHLGDALGPDAHDLFYLGGGQDRDQALCARDLATVKRDALHAAAERGAVLFGVCGGFQLLGTGYQLADELLPGLGLADLETVREEGPRLIGNVAIEVDLGNGPRVLAGFENHGGRTKLGNATPLGKVLKGHGNDGRSGFEGVRQKNVIGTYLHGPLLPKNAWFADWLIQTATGRVLESLDDTLEDAAHEAARRAAGI
jgi:CobQ-like glutamine amidotransferase family enzyme